MSLSGCDPATEHKSKGWLGRHLIPPNGAGNAARTAGTNELDPKISGGGVLEDAIAARGSQAGEAGVRRPRARAQTGQIGETGKI